MKFLSFLLLGSVLFAQIPKDRNGGGGGGSGTVNSVNGNPGPDVVLTASDIANAVDTTQTYSNPAWLTAVPFTIISSFPYNPAVTAATGTSGAVTFAFGTTKQMVNNFTLTMSGNVTSSSFSGTQATGQFMTWHICEPGTSYTFTAPTNVVNMTAIDTTINTCTTQMFFYDGTNYIGVAPGITSNTTPGVLTPTGYLIYPTGNGTLIAGHFISFTISGGSNAISTGQYDAGSFGSIGPCTITGWTLKKLPGTVDGSISIDLDGVTNSAPPSAPVTPNTTTNKLSASAPMTISSASSNAGGASAISTWTTATNSWWTFAVNVTSVTSMTGVSGTVWCQ